MTRVILIGVLAFMLGYCGRSAYEAFGAEVDLPPLVPGQKVVWLLEFTKQLETRGVPWAFADRLITQESRATLDAKGYHGESGPCQMRWQTARRYIRNGRIRRLAGMKVLWAIRYITDALQHEIHGPRICAQHLQVLWLRYKGCESLVATAWVGGRGAGDYVRQLAHPCPNQVKATL